MKLLKKIIRVLGIIVLLLFLGLFIAIHVFLHPASDTAVLEKLTGPFTDPRVEHHTFGDFKYRWVSTQQRLDTSKMTLVFVHGSPGSLLDYKRYLKDSALNAEANLIAYDRIGYGVENAGAVQESIDFEIRMLQDVTKGISHERLILVGYSYGGPIVLAYPDRVHYKVSLASAVKAEYEPLFWTLKFYDWKATRWLLPKTVQAAAAEKYSHLKDLPNYTDKWGKGDTPILNIQGKNDWIVPYKNSLFLREKIPADRFEMITLEETGHELIWSDFELIIDELLAILRQDDE